MKNNIKIIIIGGVAGGASAAARARRLSESAEIILFERGEYISFANCGLPYHIGGEITDREALLVQTPEKMMRRFNIDVRTHQEVTAIDREKKEVVVKNHLTQREYRESYDKLVLSPGAKPIRPPLPGIDDDRILSLRNIPDMDAIDTLIKEKNAKHAVVIGGGYIGLEMSEALHHRNLNVSLVELAPQVMGPIDEEMASLLHQELRLNNIDLRLGISVVRFEKENDDSVAVILSNEEKIKTDLVILAIGVKPENNLAKDAALNIGKLGGIEVNANMQTNDENIYAVGDAVEIKDFVSNENTLIPLAGPANRQGRIAAENIFGRNSTYKNTQGTGICKVFNQTVGMTGLNEKILKNKNIPYQKIYLHAASHASYYPGATPISLKLLFSPEGTILGAQAVGLNGIDKRIDVIAAAMRAKQTIYELQDEELCYAPPYGSAKDPINYAGFVAANVLEGDMPIIYAENIEKENNSLLLDVRTPEEFKAGTISGSINLPLDELRHRLNELSKDKLLIVFCKVGLRGYLACRILMQNGFQCKNLTGGYTTYQMVKNKLTTHTLPKELHSDAGEESEGDESMIKVDARGMQCPGPIQKLNQAMKELKENETLCILTTDPGFISDAPAWCETTKNKLISQKSKEGCYQTIIQKQAEDLEIKFEQGKKKLTIVVFSGDFDRAMAAFIIANGAAAMGYDVTLFFTFWGLNILRKHSTVKIKKTLLEKMFGKMMPRGPKKLALSKMNMLGMGPAMIKYIMKQKNVSSLSDLIEQAIEANVKLVGCAMSMDLMGIKHEELIGSVDQGGVAQYLNEAGQGKINLFI